MRAVWLACAVIVVTLVPGPLNARARAAGCGLPGVPTTTVYLPNITKTLGGPSGWQTPFIVQNVGTAATTLEVSFYRFSDGSLVTCRGVPALAPGTSFADVPNNDTDLPGDSQFSVVVRSFGAQVVSVVNEHQGSGIRAEALSYVGLSSGATRIALPYVAKLVAGWLTTMIVQNLGPARATVSAAFQNADGTSSVTVARGIDPGRSQFIDPTAEPALQTGTEYSAIVTSDQPIAVVVNAHNDAPTAAAPMGFSYNGVATATLGQQFLPYVARNTDGIGRQTRILVQNAGTVDATPSLSFQRLGGSPPVTATATAPVRPGRAWSFDPRFAANGTACPAAGSPTCVAEGEHAATTSGGVFAAVAIVTSSATAMGYTGSTPSPSRVYLPNVTRTLGGGLGWTTPILLQSAGAQAATIRWYRFADGSLVQTQQLTGLSAGAATRVDPRAVAGLSDDTQYAVVVDAPGPIAAIVTELNFSGGDGGMVYEGFASTRPATPVATVVSVTPASVSLAGGASQQFTATVKDQFDATMVGQATTWSVVPASLGTVNASGLFVAAQANGNGAVTATSGGIVGSAAVTVQIPSTVTIGGLSFRATSTARADVFVESTITDADAQTIVALVEPSITYIQSDTARSFSVRPQLYAFTTLNDLDSGWTSVLGASGSPPTSLNGVFIPTSRKIGLNWASMRTALPYRTVRHELTHMLEHQLAGNALIPTWFDEGMARFTDLSEPGGLYRTMESRYDTASMARTGTLLNVVDLSSTQFYGLTGSAEDYAYYESAETIRLLRADLQAVGTTRILELMGQGSTFTTAYATVAGRSFDAFKAESVARLQALANGPGVTSAPDTFQGTGLAFMVYGLAPNSTFTLSISGPASSSPSTRTVNAYGVYESYLNSSWPMGTYTITATQGATSLSTQAAKTSGADVLSAEVASVLGFPEMPPLVARE